MAPATYMARSAASVYLVVGCGVESLTDDEIKNLRRLQSLSGLQSPSGLTRLSQWSRNDSNPATAINMVPTLAHTRTRNHNRTCTYVRGHNHTYIQTPTRRQACAHLHSQSHVSKHPVGGFKTIVETEKRVINKELVREI